MKQPGGGGAHGLDQRTRRYRWSREEYERALSARVDEHAGAPQTATMHPDMAATMGLVEGTGDQTVTGNAPLVVTPRDPNRLTIVPYD